jgi:cyclophilin family peptidyl-prolyl cis-trans isomerase
MQLPPQYSLFGKVTNGLDVVLELEKVGSPGAGVPKQKVFMESVTITES